jgi:dynein heavy chain, axonemal
MANYSAVKHQSNIFFEFTSVDTLIKKFIRQVSEMVSLRRLCEDHNDKRYLNTLEEYQRQLASISKIFMNFLDSKRITYGRFCFMSDQELIQMLEHVKDARSASRFISSCFFS